jgi:hypothetical protein
MKIILPAMPGALLGALVGALLAACSVQPLPPPATPDPADAQSPIVETPYRPVLAGTAAYGPVAPKPWGVAP